MSNIATFTQVLYDKLLTNSWGTPVSLTESIDLLTDMKDVTRRLELEILLADSDMYLSQRELPWEVPFLITGYIKNEAVGEASAWTIDDHKNIIDFGCGIQNLVATLLSDKQQGLVSVPGFVQFQGKSRLVFDMEQIPCICCFTLLIVPYFIQNDFEM